VILLICLLKTNFLQQMSVMMVTPCWLSVPTCIPVTVMVAAVVVAAVMMLVI
jgi:hypothetical protein